MTDNATETRSAAGVTTHPAAVAWLSLPGTRPPAEIEVVKERKSSAVYRLHDVGLDGPVMAKRSSDHRHAIERDFYEHVLPSVPIAVPDWHGAVQGEQGNWLFISDAGDRTYVPEQPEHARLGGRLLAALHTAVREERNGLPDRSSAYYLGILRSLRPAVGDALGGPSLEDADRRTLGSLLEQLEAVESAWPSFEAACAVLPEGLVHCDFSARNLRLVDRDGANALIAFDWGTAGWGVPCVDLSQLFRTGGREGLLAYLDAGVASTSRASLDDLLRTSAAGRALRLIQSIEWAKWGLAHESKVEGAMRSMRVYEERLRALLATEAWLPS